MQTMSVCGELDEIRFIPDGPCSPFPDRPTVKAPWESHEVYGTPEEDVSLHFSFPPVCESHNDIMPDDPYNHTVKLDDFMEKRVNAAMNVQGFKVWAEFCRAALMDRCRKVEGDLRESNPEEFRKLYGWLGDGK